MDKNRIVQFVLNPDGLDIGLDQHGQLWEAKVTREHNGALTMTWRRVEQRFEP